MKSRLRGLTMAKSDRWPTPRALFQALDAEFHFDLDPCPIDGTRDGLATLLMPWRARRVFCNPPYGPGIIDWLRRGREASVAVFLLPARTDTRWFHDEVLGHADEIRFIRGRIRFGERRTGAPFPSLIAIYRNEVTA